MNARLGLDLIANMLMSQVIWHKSGSFVLNRTAHIVMLMLSIPGARAGEQDSCSESDDRAVHIGCLEPIEGKGQVPGAEVIQQAEEQAGMQQFAQA